MLFQYQLALVGASKRCQQEVARRTSVNCCWAQSLPQLEESSCVAFLSRPLDLKWVENCILASRPVLICSSAISTLAEIEQLESLVGANTGRVEIGNCLLALPSRIQILSAIRSGKLGEAGLVRIHRWVTELEDNPRGGDPRADPRWINELHMALQCALQPLTRLYAVHTPSGGQVAHLRFDGGGMALIDFVTHLPGGSEYSSLSVIGSLGSATVDDHQNLQLLFRDDSAKVSCVPEAIDAQSLMVVDFWHRASRSLQVDVARDARLDQWRNTFLAAEMLVESMHSGSAVAFVKQDVA